MGDSDRPVFQLFAVGASLDPLDPDPAPMLGVKMKWHGQEWGETWRGTPAVVLAETVLGREKQRANTAELRK